MSELAPPQMVKWTSRSSEHGDCAVAAISLATDVSYEESLAACLAVKPEVLHRGMTVNEIRGALKEMGWTCKKRAKFDVADPTLDGLLWVEDKKGEAHLIYLWVGRPIDPSHRGMSTLWLTLPIYLREGGWKARYLFVIGEKA